MRYGARCGSRHGSRYGSRSGALWGCTVHVVVEGELLAGADGARGEEGDARQALVQVLDEDVVHLQVGVALGGEGAGSAGAMPPALPTVSD